MKQPLYIHPADGSVLPFAGIYEFWHDDTKPSDDDTAWLTTFCIITTTATDDVGRVHDRMPMTVPADQWTSWLDPGTSTKQALSIMGPPAIGSLQMDLVGPAQTHVAVP